VTFDDKKTNVRQFVKALSKFGYTPEAGPKFLK
jgi:hypothetical protein